MNFDMIGPVISLGMSAIGSCVGCGIAGMACHAVMSRVDEGHAKFIGMSIAPSSQIIYGIVLMLLMQNAIKAETLSPVSAIGIGFFAGLGIMFSAIFQGKAAATGIQASAKQPAIYGKCWVALGIIETFALFSFAFAYLLL